MKTYEMLYVLDSALADEAKDAFEAKFSAIVADFNGKVVSTDKWGVKSWRILSTIRPTAIMFL